MDSITHIVVGACTGEILLGKRLGKKAMLAGAIANSLPDIDVVASAWLRPVADLLAHRGITHSLLFAWITSFLLTMAAKRIFSNRSISFGKWFWFFITQIHLHLFMDLFNAYGTGLFEPFSYYRVSFNSIFVADPLFTIGPLVVFIILLIKRSQAANRKKWAMIALVLSATYLFTCVIYKLRVDHEVRSIAAARHISYKRYLTTPTPLNNLLWFVVIQSDSGYHIGYRSVLDKKPSMDFSYFPANDFLLDSIRNSDDVKKLLRFSNGFYTVEKWKDTLVFNDLRFGQVIGWADPHARFVFHYFLQGPDDNAMVVQRGRFASWNKEAIRSMIEKIKGN